MIVRGFEITNISVIYLTEPQFSQFADASCSFYSALKMEALYSSEIPVFIQRTTGQYISVARALQVLEFNTLKGRKFVNDKNKSM
jgi:hypothetical protein